MAAFGDPGRILAPWGPPGNLRGTSAEVPRSLLFFLEYDPHLNEQFTGDKLEIHAVFTLQEPPGEKKSK